MAGVVAVVLLLDQSTKWLIRSRFLPGETRSVIGDFFYLTYNQNSGMAFGLMQGYSGLISVFSVLAIAFLIYLARRWGKENSVSRGILFSLSLVIGGAAGNLVDRMAWTGVIDFLDFGLGLYRWPAFNVADICISVGVGLLVLFSARSQDPA